MSSLILVTGADGFIGTNLIARLGTIDDIELVRIGRDDGPDALADGVARADVIFHLAGANRPDDQTEFDSVNRGLTEAVVGLAADRGVAPTIVLTSSTQAALDNPYGRSKRAAEDALFAHAELTGAPVAVFRLPNVFGKWSLPDYNTVVATFCRNAARGRPLRVHEPAQMLELVHVDAVIEEFIGFVTGDRVGSSERAFRAISPVFTVTVGDLAARIERIAAQRTGSVVPDVGDPLSKHLHAMLLTYLEPSALAVSMDKKSDERGYLFEMLKTGGAGQVFMSVTHPGVTRGNHYHHDKVERFFVVSGEARIDMRHLLTGERIEFVVRGEECRAIDIPVGFTHAITNVGSEDMIVLFWANEVFDPDRPDTYFEVV